MYRTYQLLSVIKAVLLQRQPPQTAGYTIVQLQHHESVAANNKRLYNPAGIHYGELLGAEEERQIILHVPLYTFLPHAYFCTL